MTGEGLGAGAIRTARTFDAKTGRVGTIRSTTGLGSERQDPGYTWDVLGNQAAGYNFTKSRSRTLTWTAYDAWGKRRQPSAAQTVSQLTAGTTLRGFTGHEMLDSVSLIHMNGRIYDPHLGRFLSADPTVQFPGYSQSYNRYSYVLNNPLSYTDPSGFGILGFFKGIGKLVKGVARFIGKVVRFLATNRIVQSLRTIAAGIACGPPCAAAAAGAHTALNGGGIGDIFKSMAITFASAQAFGELHQMEYGVGKIVAHGVVGGLANELRGGSFLAGF